MNRENLFFHNPYELNCERSGFQGAKDESPPQNDLKKESGASDAVTSPTLCSLGYSAAEESSEAH